MPIATKAKIPYINNSCFNLSYVVCLDKRTFNSFANIVPPSNKEVFVTFWVQNGKDIYYIAKRFFFLITVHVKSLSVFFLKVSVPLNDDFVN